MDREVTVSLFWISVILIQLFIIFVPSSNALVQIDDYVKTALPNENLDFTVTIANDQIDTETFLIQHVWENSVLWVTMDLIDNKVYDYSLSKNHGTVYGASEVDGKYGKALYFNGIDNKVEGTDDSSLNFERTNAFTITAWIKRSDSEGNQAIYSRTLGNRGISFRIINGKLWLELMNQLSPDVLIRVQGSTSLLADASYWVCATYDGLSSASGVKFYVNGVRETETVLKNNLNGTIQVNDIYNIGKDTRGTSYFKGIIDEVRIFNCALTDQEIGWLCNNSWGENLSKYDVELEPGESNQLSFGVKVPEDAKAGHTQTFLLTAFSLSNPEQISTQTAVVEVLPKYGATLSLDENEKRGRPEEILNFQADITNLGNIEDTYNILPDGGMGWNLSLSTRSVNVPFGGVGSFNVSITVPPSALPGDYASFSIQATSQGNQSLTMQVNGTAIATEIFRFNVTSDHMFKQASPGSIVIFSLELENTGTSPDTINLQAVNSSGWDIIIAPTHLSLEIGEKAKATIHVTIPEDALIGQTNIFTIRAVSTGNPAVSVDSSISIEVVTPFWDIPDVRFILGLIIGVLVATTLTTSIIIRRTKIINKNSRSAKCFNFVI